MISIRKSVNDLDRLDALRKREDLSGAIRDCYALAIDSSSHYAVEVDSRLAGDFRAHLRTIEEESRSASSVDQFRTVQASFRGELRDYRDKSSAHLQKMRKEVESATAAMIIFAETVAFNGTNHEQQVHDQLRGLESTAKKNSIADIRAGIAATVSEIESSVQRMQRDNQLIVAQLQDEIRALHEQSQQEQKALYTDRASGAWTREKIDAHLHRLLRQNRPFCLLLVCVRNYKRIDSQYSPAVMQGTLKALVGRYVTLAGEDAVIGRWSEDQFIAVLDLPPGEAIPLSAEASQKLSGSYSVQENGLAQKIAVQATAGVIDRAVGADSESFRKKIDQLAEAIAGM
jgi:GGDEF domain-containing protein